MMIAKISLMTIWISLMTNFNVCSTTPSIVFLDATPTVHEEKHHLIPTSVPRRVLSVFKDNETEDAKRDEKIYICSTISLQTASTRNEPL
ncbi:hypothetical protein P3L10_026302 [Capsicum annuum]